MPDHDYHDGCDCFYCRHVRQTMEAVGRKAAEKAIPHEPVLQPIRLEPLPKGFTDLSKEPMTATEVLRRRGDLRLPTDSKTRKNIPIYSGLIAYFPLACAAVAKHSKDSNDQHNPGEPMHWAREKSTDHLDCITRHLADRALAVAAGDVHEKLVAQRAIAWRALAQLELDEEAALAAGDNDRAVHHK